MCRFHVTLTAAFAHICNINSTSIYCTASVRTTEIQKIRENRAETLCPWASLLIMIHALTPTCLIVSIVKQEMFLIRQSSRLLEKVTLVPSRFEPIRTFRARFSNPGGSISREDKTGRGPNIETVVSGGGTGGQIPELGRREKRTVKVDRKTRA